MSAIHIVRDYPHSPAKVWHAVTDPRISLTRSVLR